MKLTKRQREILERLDAGEELDDFRHGGWWIGDEQTTGRIGFFFLRNVLVHEDTTMGAGHSIYTINEWGRRALREPDFDPQQELANCLREARREYRT